METLHLTLFMLLCLGINWSSSEILRRQRRNWIIDSFEIDENFKGPFPFPLGTVKIDKNLTIYKLFGEGVDTGPKGTLSIDPKTGMLYVHKPVDYESYRMLNCNFQAVNEENNIVDTQLGIEIKIKDANDNAPQFNQKVQEVNLPESKVQGETVATIYANDMDSGVNGKFDYKMISVTPKHDNVEFYLRQQKVSKTGSIFFKGCLEYKTARKYTILVEAKDHGKDVQLSSTCTININIMEGNNHLPVITGLTGPASAKEREENVLVTRVKVTDEDAHGSPAWKAKFTIHGDTNKHFNISTDPKTNEGLLFVKKQMDYEKSPTMNISIGVENEIPYYPCKVKTRKSADLWEIVTTGKDATSPLYGVTVVVEDVNEPPVFPKSNMKVSVRENKPAGHLLETVTAQDHDGVTGNKIQYAKENDKDNFITVDPITGKVTTAMPLDRESSSVKNNSYVVKILAFDNGTPSLTGTTTLTIGILDENDNAPFLTTGMLDLCQSDKPSEASIEAADLDEGINSGPFNFQLLGDVKGKWKIEPSQGFSTKLVKESGVHSGHHELQVKVSDLQAMSAVHNLSVTVCQCSNPEQPNCRMRKSTSSAAGGAFVGIIFFALFLVAGLLLLAFLVSCKNKKHQMIVEEEGSGQQLMTGNIEIPGTDCKVASKHKKKKQNEVKIAKESQVKTKAAAQVARTVSTSRAQKAEGQMEKLNQEAYYSHMSMGASSSMKKKQQSRVSSQRVQQTASSGRQRKYSTENSTLAIRNEILPKVLSGKLGTIQARGNELGHYAPRVYAEEENNEPNSSLDTISIPDIPFNPDSVLELDSRFNTLASVCMPSKDPVLTDL